MGTSGVFRHGSAAIDQIKNNAFALFSWSTLSRSVFLCLCTEWWMRRVNDIAIRLAWGDDLVQRLCCWFNCMLFSKCSSFSRDCHYIWRTVCKNVDPYFSPETCFNKQIGEIVRLTHFNGNSNFKTTTTSIHRQLHQIAFFVCSREEKKKNEYNRN